MENKIRALRSEMGLSQEELARRCGEGASREASTVHGGESLVQRT